MSPLLRKRSKVFDAMLSHDFSETQTKSMKLVEASATEAELFLQFLYTGSVVLDFHVIVGMSTLANMYQVPSLIDLCTKWLDNNLKGEPLHS